MDNGFGPEADMWFLMRDRDYDRKYIKELEEQRSSIVSEIYEFVEKNSEEMGAILSRLDPEGSSISMVSGYCEAYGEMRDFIEKHFSEFLKQDVKEEAECT